MTFQVDQELAGSMNRLTEKEQEQLEVGRLGIQEFSNSPMCELAFHPAADEFPLLCEERLTELAEDLRINGQREPIQLYRGRILDGRNRYLACRKAGIEPWTETLSSDVNPFTYVWSLNGQRRDLTQDQRYLIWKSCAARSGEWEAEQCRLQEEAKQARSDAAVAQSRTGSGRFADDSGPSTSCGRTGTKPRGKGSTVKADVSGTNRGSVERMDRLQRERPDLAEQVRKGEITSAEAMRQVTKPHIAQNSGDNEWYTPSEIIERARSVMGSIDLDPASSADANRVVKADRFYSEEEDGLKQPWNGNVWMNPPYSQPLIQQFSDRLVEAFTGGDVTSAVVLVNNATETRWAQSLLGAASAVCFPSARVKFWHPSKTSAPLQGQMILYFGRNEKDFSQAFQDMGVVYYG